MSRILISAVIAFALVAWVYYNALTQQ